jgi:L-arabinose isomerase
MKPKIGLLPLYLELYDKAHKGMRPRMEKFVGTIARELKKRKVEVIKGKVCRLEREFNQTVRSFEKGKACAIVTLHLAYSPSEESAQALANTELPIIVLDTTQDLEFGPGQDPGAISYNHGIHGVQDMCNLLLRNKKTFKIEAGHWKESDVIDRVVKHIQAAQIAQAMKSMRVGRVGKAFKGMGDFSVDSTVLKKTIGVTTITTTPREIARLLPDEKSPAVKNEIRKDRRRFDTSQVTDEQHRLSVRTGLAVRKWLEKEKLGAFSVNFLEITKASGVPVMPFLEASKAMGRGIGFGGEGDVLTASLVGAIASACPEVSFTEIFCPDWKGQTLFLSHMGEINPNLCADKPVLVARDWTYTDAQDPVFAAGRFKEGKAVFVNLAPGPDDSYSLVLGPVIVKGAKKDKFSKVVRGWIKPEKKSIEEFLEDYSKAGGTHHSAIVYGEVTDILKTFGEMMGWKTVII